jgi:predicted aldo/keto reductase-like oxidoreductase
VDAALAYLDLPPGSRDVAQAIEGAREALRGHCTHCRHCEPCPVGIDVAAVHLLLAQCEQGVSDELRARYAALPAKPSDCIRCEACTERCPFGVEAADNVRRAAELLG